MTNTQLALIIGSIYISHTNNKELNGIIGASLLVVAAFKGLGWL